MSKITMSDVRYDEIGEILSKYFIAHYDCSTNNDLLESFKHIGSRVDELSDATGISKDELITFGWSMVEKMVTTPEEE